MATRREYQTVPSAICTRRKVLQTALALPAVFAAPVGFAAVVPVVGGQPPIANSAIQGFVLDRRFWSPGQALPEAAEIHFVDGDVIALWYAKLDRRLREPRYVLAGRSGEDVLFVLEQLALAHGRRVTARHGKGGIVSWVIGALQSSARGE